MTAAAEMRRESDADREASKRLEKAHGERMDRLLAALEVQQRHTQQVLDTLNSNAVDALTSMLPAAVGSTFALVIFHVYCYCNGESIRRYL